jgi:hypothetical protein
VRGKAGPTHARGVRVPVPWADLEVVTFTVVHGGIVQIVLNGTTESGRRFKPSERFHRRAGGQ